MCVSQPLTWKAALENCHRFNGTLAISNTTEINTALGDMAYKQGWEVFWIGLSDLFHEWSWIDGGQLLYTHWYPNNPLADLHCAAGNILIREIAPLWYSDDCVDKAAAKPSICQYGSSQRFPLLENALEDAGATNSLWPLTVVAAARHNPTDNNKIAAGVITWAVFVAVISTAMIMLLGFFAYRRFFTKKYEQGSSGRFAAVGYVPVNMGTQTEDLKNL